MEKYIDSDMKAGKRFYQNFHDKGKVCMLNLLKFRDKADYSGLEFLEPDVETSGREAFDLYMDKTLPELNIAGSRIVFYGSSKDFLIGPQNEQWDAVLLVEHQSASKFIEFAQNKAFLANAGHRTAALEDSRLLPISEEGKIL